ncbi:MAG: class I SAM-dependent methyltransferase [Methanobacterium sp.]|jgi:2-polyprenyl-3-methyl-5-hydroxy-6-metoxy-1,4-benzoquinol methylase|nr:class I SAM-dependent methyltransferase [Methanobacterium sp.]
MVDELKNKYSFGEETRTYQKGRPQYELALKLLEDFKTSGSVLDLGCGQGEFSDTLHDLNFQVKCADGTPKLVEQVKQRGYETYLVDFEDEYLPFDDNEFELVVSLDVIEHLWNTDHYLKEICRVLKPNGHIIITTLNYNSWNYRKKHLFGNFEDFTYQSRHKKFFTYKSFREETQKYFDVKSSVGLIYFPVQTGLKFTSKFQNFLSVNIGILGKSRK